MEITRISMQKVEKENSRFLAYADIELDNCLRINGIRIIRGDSRIFAAMPNKKTVDGKFIDYVHPTNEEFRNIIDKKLEEAYNKES